MDAEMINALKELGAVAWLGLLSWQVIRTRKNGNVAPMIAELNERVYDLAQSVARIEGHMGIKKE